MEISFFKRLKSFRFYLLFSFQHFTGGITSAWQKYENKLSGKQKLKDYNFTFELNKTKSSKALKGHF